MSTVQLNQLNAFGVRVRNARVGAPHVAQGLVTLLAAARGHAKVTTATPATSAELDRLVEGWVLSLRSTWGEAVFSLPAASPARALGVARTKHGPLSVSPDEQTALPLDDPSTQARYELIERTGRAHVEQFLDGDLERAAHLALADVLGIDGRFRVAGADTPTTPGPALVGYDPNYTLALLHAPTALGLIASVEGGVELIKDLAERIAAADDPHTKLLESLHLAQARGPLAELTLLRPDGPQWTAAAKHLTSGVRNLMRWATTTAGAAPKAELLMSITDLVSLFFVTRTLCWTDGEAARESTHALLVAPRGTPSTAARAVHAAARRTVQRAEGRLRQRALPGPTAGTRAALRLPEAGSTRAEAMKADESNHNYYNRNWAPEAAACTLGASAGWLLPVHARGGARRYLAPGPAQLRTLVHSLIEPGEEVPWTKLHRRAWQAYSLCLGDVDARRFHAIGCPEHVVRLAGNLNKELLIRHGLARREADNVVMVDGGSR